MGHFGPAPLGGSWQCGRLFSSPDWGCYWCSVGWGHRRDQGCFWVSYKAECSSLQTVHIAAAEKPGTSDRTRNKLLNFGKRKSPYLYNTIHSTAVPTLKDGRGSRRRECKQSASSCSWDAYRTGSISIIFINNKAQYLSLYTRRERRKIYEGIRRITHF